MMVKRYNEFILLCDDEKKQSYVIQALNLIFVII